MGIVLFSSFTHTPEGLLELKKISQKYSDIKSYEATIKVSVTSDNSNAEKFQGKMVVDGKKYFIQSYDSDNLSNGKMVVLADHDEKGNIPRTYCGRKGKLFSSCSNISSFSR